MNPLCNGAQPVHWAASYSGLLDCLTSSPCKYIPCTICDPNSMIPFCKNGAQPIHWAASFGQLHTVMVLVKNGATPSPGSPTLITPVPSGHGDAMREKHFHVVDWLDEWASIGCPTPNKMER